MKSKQVVLSTFAALGVLASGAAFADPPRWAHAHGHWAKHSHRHVVVDRAVYHRYAYAPVRTVVVYRPPTVVVHPAPAYVVYRPVPAYHYAPLYDRGAAGAVVGSAVGAAIGYHLATH